MWLNVKPDAIILTDKQVKNNPKMSFKHKFGPSNLAITLKGLIFASLLQFSLAIFNAEELKSVNYEIDILNVPVKEGELEDLPVMQIMSKFGQQYQCQLPVLVSNENPNDGSRNPEPEIPDVNELLSPLLNAPCLLKTKDWWTYEFCYGRFIRQYHIEESQMAGPILNLGIFDQSLNSNKNLNSEGNSQLQQNRYFSQYYVNGSKCDLTGTLRSSEVRFFCETDVSDYIARVDEPETCRYIVTIHTGKVCTHPHLKPLPSVKPHMILCNPVLAEENFEKYQSRVQEEKEKSEKNRQEWISVQQQKLEELKQQKIKELKTKIQEYKDKREDGDGSSKDGDDEENINLVNEDLNDEDELESINELELMSNEMLEKLLQEKSKLDEMETVSSDISDKLVKEEAKLQETVSSQLETIKKARELLQNINSKKKEVTVQEMVSTLFSLIDNMAQAETEMNTATDRLEKIKMANKALKKKFKDGEKERLEKLESAKALVESGKRHIDNSKKLSQSDSLIEEDDKEDDFDVESLSTDSTTSEKTPSSVVQEEEKVQVRIRRINTGASKSDNKVQWFRQKDLDINQKQKLEDAVKEKLEEAGLSTNGRQIEVKIITAGYYDDEEGKDFHVFSDEETRQFQSMIMSLLARNREAKREIDRQRKMEQNYHFKWNENDIPNMDINEELNL